MANQIKNCVAIEIVELYFVVQIKSKKIKNLF